MRSSQVLLREVEYFQGVLILTTNRIVAFDTAVLSRVHHAVNFSVVRRPLEAQIWRLWFEKAQGLGIIRVSQDVEERIAHFEKDKKRSICLNGREIRNIFLMAQELNDDGSIEQKDLKKLCDWKVNFREEMNKQVTHAENLLVGKRD